MIEFAIHEPVQGHKVVTALFRDHIKPETMAGHRGRLVWKVEKDTKSRLQEEKYHAMIGDISRQCDLRGQKLDKESWKRLLIDAFKHETKDDPEFVNDWAKFGSVQLLPALNHSGFVMVGAQSRRFSVKLAAGFIEWLLAFGAENDVRWSTPKKWGEAPQ